MLVSSVGGLYVRSNLTNIALAKGGQDWTVPDRITFFNRTAGSSGFGAGWADFTAQVERAKHTTYAGWAG